MAQPEKKLTLQDLMMTRQTSWADETEEEDMAPLPELPAASRPAQPEQAQPPQQPPTQQQPQQRAAPRDDHRQPERRGFGGSNRDSRDARDSRDSRDSGRRFEDRREERPRGGDERRGGFGSGFGRGEERREGGRPFRGEDRRGGAEGADAPRERTPIPSHGPWKAYVGNLPYDQTQDTITHFFTSADSSIQVAQVTFPRRHDDKPVGHVYVEFAERASLEAALKLDGADMGGRPLKVDVATARQGDSRGFGGRTGGFERRAADAATTAEPTASNEPPKERKRLQLAPRTVTASSSSAPSTKADIFGGAKPREEILISRGVDPVSIDAKAESAPAAAPAAKKEKPSADEWTNVKGEKGAQANKARAADVASHPPSSAASSGRTGVVRGGRAGAVGARGSERSGQKQTQGGNKKKEEAGSNAPANLFAALNMDDEEEEEE